MGNPQCCRIILIVPVLSKVLESNVVIREHCGSQKTISAEQVLSLSKKKV